MPSIQYFSQRDDAKNKAQKQSRIAQWTQRGKHKGWLLLGHQKQPDHHDKYTAKSRWITAQPIYLASFASQAIEENAMAIQAAANLAHLIAAGEEPDTLLDTPRYQQQLSSFEMLGSSADLDDDQEIAKIDFDRIEKGQCLAEDLWLKVAWLSLQDGDASLRFRFSYGMEGEENVAANFQKQQYAADLCEALFPESRIISQHTGLAELLQQSGITHAAFVERIVYFNAPDGGAFFHQDVERGHAGVVYAQLSGETFWLTLSKSQLLDEIEHYFQETDQRVSALKHLADQSRSKRALHLDQREESIEILLNQTPAFSAQLVQKGYGYWLTAGDLILLPQQNADHCAWHAVYCLGEKTGEGISFAIRHKE